MAQELQKFFQDKVMSMPPEVCLFFMEKLDAESTMYFSTFSLVFGGKELRSSK